MKKKISIIWLSFCKSLKINLSEKSIKMRIGYAKFKQTMTEEEQNQLITAQISKVLSQKAWYFRRNYEYDAKIFIQQMEQAQSEQVQIENSTDTPLKDLSHIRFINLKKIYLAFNGLNNMQPLAFMDAPNLQNIILAQNTLTIFKPANKIIFPHLDHFSIDQNRIQEIDLSRYKINNCFTFLGFTYVWRFEMIPIISFYAKLETINPHIEFVNYNFLPYLPKQKSKSIPQTKVVKCLIRKLNLVKKYPFD